MIYIIFIDIIGIAQTGTMLVPRDDGGYDTVEVVHIMESPSGTPIVDNILRSGDLVSVNLVGNMSWLK